MCVILVLLVLGTIVNVAVAWPAVLTFDPITPTNRNEWARDCRRPNYKNWWVEVQKCATGVRVRSEWIKSLNIRGGFSRTRQSPEALIPRWASLAEPVNGGPEVSSRFYIGEVWGWPAWSMHSRFVRDLHTFEDLRMMSCGWRVGEFPNSHPPEARLLPLILLWPGFAINTLFYATILWAVLALPAALSRTRRRRRGLCPACAYPVGTSPVCTECGAAVVCLKDETDNTP